MIVYVGRGRCSRDFTLAMSRNNYLPSIGWKDRVSMDGRETYRKGLVNHTKPCNKPVTKMNKQQPCNENVSKKLS